MKYWHRTERERRDNPVYFESVCDQSYWNKNCTVCRNQNGCCSPSTHSWTTTQFSAELSWYALRKRMSSSLGAPDASTAAQKFQPRSQADPLQSWELVCCLRNKKVKEKASRLELDLDELRMKWLMMRIWTWPHVDFMCFRKEHHSWMRAIWCDIKAASSVV